MATLDELENLLAEALQCLDDSAGVVRNLEELETKPNLVRLGHAINNVWELREQIHQLRPDLKPPFVVEFESDKSRYETLSKIADEAHKAEIAGAAVDAELIFQRLYAASERGYFRMVAEAGMYRLSKSGRTDA